MEDDHNLLKCDTHHITFNNVISSLRYKGTYTDVTLACNGKFYILHKLVLAICSEYFSEILERTECANPMIILTGIQCSDMELLIEYMYTGEVNVRKDRISSLMKAAECLRIKGLEFHDEETKSLSCSSNTEEQSPLLKARRYGENRSTDFSPNRSCTSPTQSPKSSDKQGEEYPIQEIKIENDEGAEGMSIKDEVEDVSDNENYLATDLSDLLQTVKEDDPLSMSDYDDSDLPCNSRKETDTTPSCVRDNSRITEGPPLKRRRTSEDTSTGLGPSTTSNSSRSVTKPLALENITQNKVPCNEDNVTEDKLEITPGCTNNSQNELYGGYRYSKDGKILKSGHQSWRCVIKGCEGRIHTLDDKHVTVKHEHFHKPDLGDCNVKAATQTKPSVIIAQDMKSIERPFQCSQCCKAFSHKGNLNKHMSMHTEERPFQCYQCNKAFKDNSTLKKHLKIHSGDKPFQCSQCDKVFSQSGHLTGHMMIHTGERQFSCSLCGMDFYKRSNLNNHMKIHSGEKPFQCSLCNKAVKDNSSLKRHLMIHSVEKPYQCSQCDKVFSQNDYRIAHMMIHAGERQHECSECNKSFLKKSYLICHMRTHTGEKTYQCSLCNKAYTQKSHHKRHMKTHNGERQNQSLCLLEPVVDIKTELIDSATSGSQFLVYETNN